MALSNNLDFQGDFCQATQDGALLQVAGTSHRPLPNHNVIGLVPDDTTYVSRLSGNPHVHRRLVDVPVRRDPDECD
jgi:hypothetical protein